MNHDLALVSPVRRERSSKAAQLTQRVVLYRGELYRVPTSYRLLRMKAGTAWVSQARQDHLLDKGQELPLERTDNMALVSSLGCEPAVIEFLI